MSALISVVIPIYNVELYLERCLGSVLNSTYKNLEIICVNDGSTDSCQEILERYAMRDDRIQVVFQKNQGLSAARNSGIDLATGEYLFYLDSDDWVHQQAFEFLLCAAEESGADIVLGGKKDISDYDAFEQDSNYVYAFDGNTMTAADYVDKSGRARDVVWGALYRSACTEGCRFPAGKTYAEDAYYNTLLISRDKAIRFAFVDFPLYYYYAARPGSIMRGANANVQLANIKWWLQNIESFKYKNYALNNVFRYIFFYRYEGLFYQNPSVARKNFSICVKLALPYFWKCREMSTKQRLKALAVIVVPELYRKFITAKDPSYKGWNAIAREEMKTFILKRWSEV